MLQLVKFNFTNMLMNANLSDLSPSFFLQTFILELMHASEQQGQEHCEQLIEHIARTAGCFFEESYRNEKNTQAPLNRESYTDLILSLKNNIGGKFSLAHSDQDCITVVNSQCPFGDRVTNFPELCRMTSSVFGGIAARNLGYAKVEIKKSIARKDGKCEVCVHTNPERAKNSRGTVYLNSTQNQEHQDFDELQSRIKESMQNIWRKSTTKKAQNPAPAIIAKSPTMQNILQSIEVIAPTAATVLIKGETGVGKELIARAIHAMSNRSEKKFMAINCGAIPESLIESALFGHEKGAFTGAIEVHEGIFERADSGTLFLDEVDSLSPAAQTRLLRVIQEGELERVGGKQTLAIDVRIISATNQDLAQLVIEKQFRKDLFYRLNVISLFVPPLAERPEDLPFLVHLILQQLNKKYDKNMESVSREIMQKIRNYAWPGNVRELENVLERAYLFANGNEITQMEIAVTVENTFNQSWDEVKSNTLMEIEQTFIKNALSQFQGDVKKVAENMDITPRAVYGKLKKYGINASSFR